MAVQRILAISGLLAGLLVLALILDGAAHHGSSGENWEVETIGAGTEDFEELSERFRQLAEDRGAVYAFEVLKRVELPPQTDVHLLGHVVGDELYGQKGVGGIADCTQDFRNACSHSIVIGALNEFGQEALPLIRDACRKAPGGSGAYTMCFHGLGHGVFAYFGYSIQETVDFCRITGTDEYNQREYIECVGGMVMELMGGGGHDRQKWLEARERYLSVEEPLAPCMGELIPDIARTICLMYITPYLWELAGIDLGRPNPTQFPRAFLYCDAIPRAQQRLRDACFGGFGKEFVPLAGARDVRNLADYSDAQFRDAISWCELAGAEDGRHACIADGVASVFWGGENDPETAIRFCHLVPDSTMHASCFTRLAQDIRLYIIDSTVRMNICARLPEAFVEQCTVGSL